MSYEVEMKFRTPGHSDLVERLAALGAEPAGEVVQEDAYLAHPARDFAVSNEALRLRRIGAENRITYKGPRLGGPTKTREEIELAFEDGEPAFGQMHRLFTNLGFRPVAVVRKTRRRFHLKFGGHDIEVALDAADSLGEFAEVEAIAATEAGLPAAQGAVLELAGALGLSEVEPRSYLRMFLDRQAALGPPPS